MTKKVGVWLGGVRFQLIENKMFSLKKILVLLGMHMGKSKFYR